MPASDLVIEGAAPGQRISLVRLMTAVVLVAALAELAYTTVNISAMPVYIRAHNLRPQWVAIAATSFILVEGLLKSPFGVLGDRVGRRVLIFTGPCLSIFTCAVTPHISNPWILIILRVLDGIGAAALWPAAFSLIGDHVPEKRRATAMSFFNLAYLLGLALGPLLGGAVNNQTERYLRSIGYHQHHAVVQSKEASFYVAAVLFALTAIIAVLFIPRLKPHPHEPGDSEGFSFHSFGLMLKRMPMTLLMTFVTFLGIGLIMAYVKLFAMERLALSELEFGKLLIGPALIIAALAVPLGTTGDRIGKARAVKVGIGLCALSYWAIILTFSERSLIAFGSLLGIGFIIAFPAWMALVATDCGESERGAVIGAVGTSQGIGAIAGVVLSGLLYPLRLPTVFGIKLPDHALPFLSCALMLTLSFILALATVREPAPRPAAPGT